MMGRRIELDYGRAEESAGKGGVHQIAQINASILRGVEERRIVREIALNMPGAR